MHEEMSTAVHEHGVARAAERGGSQFGGEARNGNLEMQDAGVLPARQDDGRRDADHPSVRVGRDIRLRLVEGVVGERQRRKDGGIVLALVGRQVADRRDSLAAYPARRLQAVGPDDTDLIDPVAITEVGDRFGDFRWKAGRAF